DVFEENLTAPLALTDTVTIPVVLYHFVRHQIAFGTNPSRALAFQANFNFGGYYGGRRDQYTGRLFWKPSEHVGVSVIEGYNVVRLPQGRLKKLRGCGSKVSASAGLPCDRPISSAAAITARWPR